MPANPLRGAVDGLANSRGRSAQHIALGVGLTVGAVAISALVAKLNALRTTPSSRCFVSSVTCSHLFP